MKSSLLLFFLGFFGCSKDLGVKNSVYKSGPEGSKLSDPQPEILDFKEGFRRANQSGITSPIQVQQKSESAINSYKSALDFLNIGLDPSQIREIASQIPRDTAPDLTAFEQEINNKIAAIEASFCDVSSDPSFDTEILPIMTKYCIACHSGTFAAVNGVGYSLYQNFGNTSIATIVLNSFNGTRMPPSYFPKPSSCIKSIINRWVANGGD